MKRTKIGKRVITIMTVNVILGGFIEPCSEIDAPTWTMGEFMKMDLFIPGTNVMVEYNEYEDFISYFDANESNIEESLKEDYFVIHSADKKSNRLLAEHKVMYRAMTEKHLEDETSIQDENGSPDSFRDVVDNLTELGIIDEEAMIVFATVKK
jgi:hypothetical protein